MESYVQHLTLLYPSSRKIQKFLLLNFEYTWSTSASDICHVRRSWLFFTISFWRPTIWINFQILWLAGSPKQMGLPVLQRFFFGHRWRLDTIDAPPALSNCVWSPRVLYTHHQVMELFTRPIKHSWILQLSCQHWRMSGELHLISYLVD